MAVEQKMLKRGHFVGPEYHKRLLSDGVRMEAFRQAIEELVRPGMVVADVGTGTGLLAFLARRAGARIVYAIEPAPVIHAARRAAQANGLTGIHFLQQDILETTLPEPVDLVISECLGSFLITDEMLPVFIDLRRHLAPGGIVCPSRVQLQLAPAGMLAFRSVKWWNDRCAGFDLSAVRGAAINRAYLVHAEAEDLVARPQQFADLCPHALRADQIRVLSGELCFDLDRHGPCNGVLGWFDAQLSPGVTLSTAPGIRTHWGQMFFPLDGLPMRLGDQLRFHLHIEVEPDSAVAHFHWQGELLRQGEHIAHSSHSTRNPWGEED